MESKTLVRMLSEQADLRDIHPVAARAVMALRYSIVCRKAGHNPLPELARRWGTMLAAHRFYVVMEAVGHIWPDPFAVAPPCCTRVSFDEALLASLVGVAMLDNRWDFDRMCVDMLSSDEREMLYTSIQNFLRAAPPAA